jgi:hypothetical protein
LQEASEFKTNPAKQAKTLQRMQMIGEKEYKKYQITCEARLQGINSYLDGIATLFNDNEKPEEVFDQLVRADQAIGSTDYSLNSDIARFIAKHDATLEKQYKRFLFKKHRVGTPDAFCGGLTADAEKFYGEDELGKTLMLAEAQCGDAVTVLNLSHNRLTALPPELGKLTQLQSLYLGGNQLEALPKEIGNLTKLQTLDLADNRLATLPKELGMLPRLQILDLGINQIAALPKELGALAQLRELYLNHNRLTAIPKELGALAQLRELYLNHNRLTAIPKELGALTHLEELNLSGNRLTALPAEIGNLTKLQTLDLADNPLQRLPRSVCLKLQKRHLNTNIDFEPLC